MQINDVQYIWMTLFALIIAIPIHEFAHALSAVNNGDDGPRRDNRLTIFPWDHFDPVGAIAVVVSTVFGFGIGWGRPVMVNPGVLRNPKWDMCKIAAWGPLSNLLLAIAAAVPLRFGWIPIDDEGFFRLFFHFIQVNLALMLFNLIPVGPLDGAKILHAFLPDKQAYEFGRFMEQFGFIMLLLLITAGRPLLSLMVGAPMVQMMGWLLGPQFSFG